MDPRVENVLAEWSPTVSADETSDPLWNLLAYRVARCLLDQALGDRPSLELHVDRVTVDQLFRAVSSIGANIAEGYSRRSPADRSRFYAYAFGSARETMLWYRSIAWSLDRADLDLRMAFLAQERRLLIGLLKAVQKRGGLRYEPGA